METATVRDFALYQQSGTGRTKVDKTTIKHTSMKELALVKLDAKINEYKLPPKIQNELESQFKIEIYNTDLLIGAYMIKKDNNTLEAENVINAFKNFMSRHNINHEFLSEDIIRYYRLVGGTIRFEQMKMEPSGRPATKTVRRN